MGFKVDLNFAMNRELLLALLILAGVVWGESCNSCGMECQSACGTRHFKSCCFNYLKKRSQLSEPLPPSLDPSLKLELWLAKSRNPFFLQRSLVDATKWELAEEHVK